MTDAERWLADLDRAPTLRGSRIVLRAPHAGDLDGLFALWSDREVMRYWSRPAMTERREAQALLDDMLRGFVERTELRWVLADAAGGAALGTLGLFSISVAQQRAEIGYALQRAFWGTGMAHEALELAMAFAFGPLALQRLEADIDPRNLASIRLIERCGFVREGLLRERWRVAGEVQDAYFYGLLKREWSPSH